MSQKAYIAPITAEALVAATAETACLIIAGAAEKLTICEFSVSIDTAGSILVELVESTQATAGTSASLTLKQIRGFVGIDTVNPAQVVANRYTAEPTVLTRLKAWRFTGPGPLLLQWPLGREVESLVSGATKYKALGLRLTAAATANADGYVEFEVG